MYLFTRAFIVNLSDRFVIEGRLLGKHICFRMSDDCILTMVFPSIIRKRDRFILDIPGCLDKFGIGHSEWGGLYRYVSIEDVNTLEAWISAILVLCSSNDDKAIPTSSEIKAQGDKLIHALQIINPDAIYTDSYKHSTDLCEVSSEVMLKSDEKRKIVIGVKLPINKFQGYLSFTDLKHAIRYFNKQVSVPYEMLDNARRNLSRKDFRSTVLHCATAIEFRLKKLLVAFLDVKITDKTIKEYVLKQADGYSKLVELCKKCSIPLDGVPNVKETIFDVRNRVIHGGYLPTYHEANVAYENTRQTLSILKTQMFE